MSESSGPAAAQFKGSPVRTILMVVALAGAVVFGLYVYGNHDSGTKAPKPTNARVGDCLHQLGLTAAETVKCDDPKAEFKVVGRVDDKYQFEAQSGLICGPWPETTTTYWEAKPGGRGTAYCLANLK